MLFRYKGLDSSGEKINSKIEADDLNHAKLKLRSQNILYEDIKEDYLYFLDNFFSKNKSSISLSTLSNISRELSIYLKSGISLVGAVKLLNITYKENKKLNAFFESISSYLNEGKSFHSALEIQNIYKIPEFYIQSIKVSESGGLLENILEELSSFLKDQDRIVKQAKNSLIYPLFILIVAIGSIIFMLSFVVPKITAIFVQLDQELPLITKIVVGAGDIFFEYYWVIVLFIVFIIGSFLYLYKYNYSFRYFIDKSLLHIPYIKSILEYSDLSRFAYMNSILISSGVPVAKSFNLSSEILKNTVLKSIFKTASNKVVEGEKLSKILKENKLFNLDKAFMQALAVGEDTSQIGKMLENLAKLYNQSNKDKITVFLSLLEPFMMLVVGGIIGFIVIAMLLPIFSISVSR
ncbi:MAG: type II secretion system F family protein [Arcobacteraceae bacterium]|nr:type II secretion system F family protein [Arcobacteraceae bacterium]